MVDDLVLEAFSGAFEEDGGSVAVVGQGRSWRGLLGALG